MLVGRVLWSGTDFLGGGVVAERRRLRMCLPEHSLLMLEASTRPPSTQETLWLLVRVMSLSPASPGWCSTAPSVGLSDPKGKAELCRKKLSGDKHLAGLLLPGGRR